jgi:hypothetical protein
MPDVVNLVPELLSYLGLPVGEEAAYKRLARGERSARADILGGYGRARGYEEPIYGTGLEAYERLAGEYGRGEFDRPEFAFDPQSVFQDPEFAAAMRAGGAALGSSAEARGDLFSTASQQALQKFGQDLFARRSDELFQRAKDVYGLGRQRALDRFALGMQLAEPGLSAAPRLAGLSADEARLLAESSRRAADIRAAQLRKRASLLGDVLGTGAAIGRTFATGGAGGAGDLTGLAMEGGFA